MRHLLFLSLLAFSLFVTPGYGKDDPLTISNCTAADASKEVGEAFAAFEDAIGNYTNNPSAENSAMYKLKAQHYLNVLKSFERCLGVGDTPEWQESVREVEAEVALIQP